MAIKWFLVWEKTRAVLLTLRCRARIGWSVTMLLSVVSNSHTMISLLLFGFCFCFWEFWILYCELLITVTALSFQVSDGLNSGNAVRTRTLRASSHWRRQNPRVLNSGPSLRPPNNIQMVFFRNHFLIK